MKPLDFVKFLLYRGLSYVDYLPLFELGDLHQCVQDWALKKLSCTLIQYQSPEKYIVALTVHWVSPLPLHMVFLNPRVCWSPLLCTILALLGLLLCRLPAPSELGDLHKRVRDWAVNKAFSYNPHWVSVNMSNMVFFNPRDWWNPPWTFSPFWLYQVFFHVDFLIWTQLVDVHKHVQHWALKIAFSYNSDIRSIWYWSSAGIFWSQPLTGSS